MSVPDATGGQPTDRTSHRDGKEGLPSRDPMVEVDALAPEDWPAVKAIYEEGIATGDATFDSLAPTWEAWDGDHITSPRLVVRADGDVVAWAALMPVSRRPVYRGVA